VERPEIDPATSYTVTSRTLYLLQ